MKKIIKDTTIKELIEERPETIEVLFKYGLACTGCPASFFEKIGDMAEVYGINTDNLLKELNESVLEGNKNGENSSLSKL